MVLRAVDLAAGVGDLGKTTDEMLYDNRHMSEISRIYYNKLIRDNVPSQIKAKRQECEVRKITDVQELQQQLFKKVQEKRQRHYQ